MRAAATDPILRPAAAHERASVTELLPEWDIRADHHDALRAPSGMTAIAYRLELGAGS